jgi:hypothetical protein
MATAGSTKRVGNLGRTSMSKASAARPTPVIAVQPTAVDAAPEPT